MSLAILIPVVTQLLIPPAIVIQRHCIMIQQPTLSILAVCEPTARWFKHGACIMCVTRDGRR